MKIDINQTVKEIMQWKEQLGEFSLDLYYDDCSHWIPYVAKLHSVCYKTFCHHERAADFDTAVIKTKAYLREIIYSGLTIADLVRDPRLAPGQRPRGGTTNISINKSMENTRELFSDEAFAKRECECNGYKFHPKPFVCRRCGTVNDATFRWVEGNRSIQQRCAGCDAYITCVKYDPRDTGDKINDPIYKP